MLRAISPLIRLHQELWLVGLPELTLGRDLGFCVGFFVVEAASIFIRGPVDPVSPLLGRLGPWGFASEVTGQLSDSAHS